MSKPTASKCQNTIKPKNIHAPVAVDPSAHAKKVVASVAEDAHRRLFEIRQFIDTANTLAKKCMDEGHYPRLLEETAAVLMNVHQLELDVSEMLGALAPASPKVQS